MIAALCVRRDSVYKARPGVDCFDADRDALSFSGGMPVIAHPPCRGWGRLRHMAKVRSGELDLARFCVQQVRACGGVLEHPSSSTLWPDQNLPAPGFFDEFGGWTYVVNQSFFGHRAPKLTWLYIVGVAPGTLPNVPFHLALLHK